MTAQLIYYPDSRPGITRKRCGRGFSYIDPAGCRIDDRDERRRLQSLAVPPAYDEVWISPKRRGHLQASGRDARGRKQYRYHPDWMQMQAERKYAGLADFGRALPGLRRRVARTLENAETDADFATAAVIALLDRLALRVGSPEYVEENGSYGVTTLTRRHVALKDGEIRLSYRGKGGKRVRSAVKDRRLHRAIQRLEGLGDAQVFSWRNGDGETRSVQAQHVKQWIDEASDHAGFSAKTFRTWSGTLTAFRMACETPPEEKLTVAAMAEHAAARLHNTPTIARNSYIHPEVLELCDPDRRAGLAGLKPLRLPGLRAQEGGLIALLGG